MGAALGCAAATVSADDAAPAAAFLVTVGFFAGAFFAGAFFAGAFFAACFSAAGFAAGAFAAGFAAGAGSAFFAGAFAAGFFTATGFAAGAFAAAFGAGEEVAAAEARFFGLASDIIDQGQGEAIRTVLAARVR